MRDMSFSVLSGCCVKINVLFMDLSVLLLL